MLVYQRVPWEQYGIIVCPRSERASWRFILKCQDAQGMKLEMAFPSRHLASGISTVHRIFAIHDTCV